MSTPRVHYTGGHRWINGRGHLVIVHPGNILCGASRRTTWSPVLASVTCKRCLAVLAKEKAP